MPCNISVPRQRLRSKTATQLTERPTRSPWNGRCDSAFLSNRLIVALSDYQVAIVRVIRLGTAVCQWYATHEMRGGWGANEARSNEATADRIQLLAPLAAVNSVDEYTIPYTTEVNAQQVDAAVRRREALPT